MRLAPARRVTVLLFAILVAGACGDDGSAGRSMPPAPTPVGPPETLPPPQTSEPASVAASPGATPAPPTTSPSGGTVVRDDTLLGVLPSDIDGAPVIVEEQSFAEAAADPAFADNVERAAFAVVTTPTDLASGVVAKLRAGVFDAAFFADWRETYNDGACAQAGGVATNAETQLEGRTVYITTCAGGMLVYHTHLEEQDAIVSLFSLGEARFGERLMRGLRP